MDVWNSQSQIYAHMYAQETLLNATKIKFSNEIQAVKNCLKSERGNFSKDILDQALLRCSRKGILILIPDIIAAGANVEAIDENGNTPLLLCAWNRHESCAKCLIEVGANVNAVNYDGNTPLIASVINGNSHGVTKLLMSCQNIRLFHVNNVGLNALVCAIQWANVNAIKLLIDAEPMPYDDSFLDSLTYKKGLVSLVQMFNLEKKAGVSPLLQAVLNRDLESALILISMDDSIINKMNVSYTSLMIQFFKSIQDNDNVVYQPEIMMFEFLLKHLNENSISLSEQQIIMDCAIAIGDLAIVDGLSMFGFVISYQNLRSVVSKPDFLRFLLTLKHTINKFDHNNQPVYDGSPLQIAMLEVEIESAKTLIQHGAFIKLDIAIRDAVQSNQEMSLKLIIEEFSDEVQDELKSPKLLHNAVENSAVNIIPVLLDHGVDINAECEGRYCLSLAIDFNVLELLLSRGADPNIKIGPCPHTHLLHNFLLSQFHESPPDFTRHIPQSGLSTSFFKRKTEELVECLLRHGVDIDLQDGLGQTVLHIVDCRFGSDDLIKLLLDSGADVNIVNDKGQSPLWKAVKDKDVEKVKRLLCNGANVDLKDHHGRTALHLAATMFYSNGIMDLLIKYGADVNSVDNSGQSPLRVAVVFEQTKNVQRLIDAGADINFVCKSTGKPLLFDAENRTILNILLDKGVDVKTIDGCSPLNFLLAKRNIGKENVKRLIDAGCDVNHIDKDDCTVLILATKYLDRPLLEMLIENGADLSTAKLKYPLRKCLNPLFYRLWDEGEMVTSCIRYLIENTNILNVHACIIHIFLASGNLSLIPVSISRGLAPSYLSIETPAKSPLMMALFLNQTDLARFFINNRYMVKSDIDILNGNEDFQMVLRGKSSFSCLDLLKTFSQNPLSLETLCFVVLSDPLGTKENRRVKVQKLGLPQIWKDSLLFKNVSETEMEDTAIRDRELFNLLQLNFFRHGCARE